MRLAVWVREIADTRNLVGEILDSAGVPRWSEWEGRVDPEDLNALEMALQWKDRDTQVEVIALSVGHPKKLDVLRECLYRGVDDVIRLVGAPTQAALVGEARLVASAVRRLEAQVVFTGVQINETECAQKGVLVARSLGWPVVSYVEAIEGTLDGALRLRRAVEQGLEVVEVDLPAVVSVGVALLKDDPRAPRSARAKLKLQHKKTPIKQWEASELGLEPAAQPAAVRPLAFRPEPQKRFPARLVQGTDASELKAMLEELRSQGLVR
ncbi:MAG: electron transfer flavoprotein subunit beta/FixA family protein [Thermodesulfobacteriota bacterium]